MDELFEVGDYECKRTSRFLLQQIAMDDYSLYAVPGPIIFYAANIHFELDELEIF